VGENYIVMEFVEGDTLRALESTRKLLDLARQAAARTVPPARRKIGSCRHFRA